MKKKDLNSLNSDAEDVADVICKIEATFSIIFEDNELYYVKTFGEFCDCIVAKVKHTEVYDCTTQQAFYKLKKAFADVGIDSTILKPSDNLEAVFSKKKRRKIIRAVENQLGFKLNILEIKHWISAFIAIGAIVIL